MQHPVADQVRGKPRTYGKTMALMLNKFRRDIEKFCMLTFVSIMNLRIDRSKA